MKNSNLQTIKKAIHNCIEAGDVEALGRMARAAGLKCEAYSFPACTVLNVFGYGIIYDDEKRWMAAEHGECWQVEPSALKEGFIDAIEVYVDSPISRQQEDL